MDSVTPEERSEIMRHVRHKDTKPEVLVQRMVHRMGYRYRLHRRDLPGTPGLTFSSQNKAGSERGSRLTNCDRALR
jgi:DNA mismatch endonuclease (patch repair protein)